jgi:hypothetical protein
MVQTMVLGGSIMTSQISVLFVVVANKNREAAVTHRHTKMLLFINSQYVSAQTGHHQVILEEIYK